MGNWNSRTSEFPFGTLVDRFAAHQHRRAEPGELEGMLGRVEKAFGRRFLSPAAIQAVDDVTGSTVWLVSDQGACEGVSLWVPLSEAGAAAVLARRFCSEDIDLAHLAPAGGPFAAVYHWGYCGFSKPARRSIMTLCAELLEGPLRPFNVYGRVITDEGAAAASRLGITPCLELGEGMHVHRAQPPEDARRAVA